MNTNEMIFKVEYPYVGGVTIHGVIGIRDYNMTTYEVARGLYIREAKYTQMMLGLTDEQMLTETAHRTNCSKRVR